MWHVGQKIVREAIVGAKKEGIPDHGAVQALAISAALRQTRRGMVGHLDGMM